MHDSHDTSIRICMLAKREQERDMLDDDYDMPMQNNDTSINKQHALWLLEYHPPSIHHHKIRLEHHRADKCYVWMMEYLAQQLSKVE